MSTKNVHQKNRPVSQKVVVASREDILLQGMKQCIWATVNFLDISTTLQVVIMHDLCGEVQHPRQCEEQKFDVPVLICVKKLLFFFPLFDSCQEIVNFKNLRGLMGKQFLTGMNVTFM